MFGLSLSVASTVVLLRALEQRGALDSVNGQIARRLLACARLPLSSEHGPHRIGEALAEHGAALVVVEENRETVEKLREPDAWPSRLLMPPARRMVEIARMLNPRVQVLLRTHSDWASMSSRSA